MAKAKKEGKKKKIKKKYFENFKNGSK